MPVHTMSIYQRELPNGVPLVLLPVESPEALLDTYAYLAGLNMYAPVYAYGGYLGDYIALSGDISRTPDMDFITTVANYNSWPASLRKQFRLSAKSWAYRRAQRRLGHKGRELPRPYVLESLFGSPVQKKAGCKVGLTLCWNLDEIGKFVNEIDLGFRQIAMNAQGDVVTTNGFWNDLVHQTITIARLGDVEDLGRTIKRAGRFVQPNERYHGWGIQMPAHFITTAWPCITLLPDKAVAA